MLNKSLVYLSEALPVKGRAFSLRVSFNLSLRDSLKYLLEVCKAVTSTELFLLANQKLASLNIEEKISGFLSAIHADLFNAIEKENINEINEIVFKLTEYNFHIKEITYTNISTLNNYYYLLFKKISSQEIIEDIIFFPLSLQDYACIKKATQRGFKVLEYLTPNFFEESQELIGEILILNTQGIKQGSSADLLGIIYKSYLHKWKKLTDIIDFLIHEQSHLYVYLLNNIDPIVLNPTDLHTSPLRKEKRPLMGVYHATFVLARVYHVLTKALDLNEIPAEEKDYCKELLDYYQKRFKVGLEVLKTHAKMTPLGEGLILSASKLVP